MRRRILAAGAAALALTFALAGCSSSDRVRNGDDLRETMIRLQDGRVVTCVVYDDSRYAQGGLSCDWDGAAR